METNKDQQEPILKNNANDEHIILTLCTGASPVPPPPPPERKPDLYLSSMHGLFLEHTPQLPSFNPYLLPQSPNPNFQPVQNPSHAFVPDFGPLEKLLNPNLNLVPNGLPSYGPIPRHRNPNPNKSAPSYGAVQASKQLAPRKRRSSASRGLRAGKNKTVPVLFEWATDQRATVHSLDHLVSKGIDVIAGEVQCKRCEKKYQVGYNLRAEFSKLRSFITDQKEALADRSAEAWDNPVCIDCKNCKEKECVKGVVAEKKREINWLFLLLGGFLCCCTLEQLKYFCKHTGNHRTGAKNRVLYLTYLGICKQLDPTGPFDPLSR